MSVPAVFQQKKQELSYLYQLERMVVQRIRGDIQQSRSRGVSKSASNGDAEELSPLSREINEELDRLESLVSNTIR